MCGTWGGGSTERVEVDSTTNQTITLPELEPDELAALQKLIGKMDTVTDAEFTVQPEKVEP